MAILRPFSSASVCSLMAPGASSPINFVNCLILHTQKARGRSQDKVVGMGWVQTVDTALQNGQPCASRNNGGPVVQQAQVCAETGRNHTAALFLKRKRTVCAITSEPRVS